MLLRDQHHSATLISDLHRQFLTPSETALLLSTMAVPRPERAGYNEADLAAAVAETKARQALGQGSVRAVSSLYDIPTTTLARHVADPDLSTKKGAGTVLSAEGEAALLDWILAQSSTQTSLSTADIRRKAAELEAHEAKEAGRDAHWSDGACWRCCCCCCCCCGLVPRSLASLLNI